MTPEAEAAWVAEIQRLAYANRDFPGVLHARLLQQPRETSTTRARAWRTRTYAPGINAFNALLAEWREQGNLEGFQVN